METIEQRQFKSNELFDTYLNNLLLLFTTTHYNHESFLVPLSHHKGGKTGDHFIQLCLHNLANTTAFVLQINIMV